MNKKIILLSLFLFKIPLGIVSAASLPGFNIEDSDCHSNIEDSGTNIKDKKVKKSLSKICSGNESVFQPGSVQNQLLDMIKPLKEKVEYQQREIETMKKQNKLEKKQLTDRIVVLETGNKELRKRNSTLEKRLSYVEKQKTVLENENARLKLDIAVLREENNKFQEQSSLRKLLQSRPLVTLVPEFERKLEYERQPRYKNFLDVPHSSSTSAINRSDSGAGLGLLILGAAGVYGAYNYFNSSQEKEDEKR